ncbi:hypothetical protein BOC36_00875 [Burkholderia pseudomallei]|nr:hypothetical protein BOC36_00875 [Burkholderia pseudomallei]
MQISASIQLWIEVFAILSTWKRCSAGSASQLSYVISHIIEPEDVRWAEDEQPCSFGKRQSIVFHGAEMARKVLLVTTIVVIDKQEAAYVRSDVPVHI